MVWPLAADLGADGGAGCELCSLTAAQHAGRICRWLPVPPGRLISAGCPCPHWQHWDGLNVPKPTAVSDSDAAHSPQGVARGTPKPPLPGSRRKGNLGSRADLLLTRMQVLLGAEKGKNPAV